MPFSRTSFCAVIVVLPCKIYSPAAGKINGGRYQHATLMSIVCTCTWLVFELLKSFFLRRSKESASTSTACCRAWCLFLPQAHICNCDCFGSLRPQLLHIAAGSESSSGDSERPFLRSSFCKGLYYSFVEALEYSVPSSIVCHQISSQRMSGRLWPCSGDTAAHSRA